MEWCVFLFLEVKSFYSEASSKNQFEIYKPNTEEDWNVKNFTEKFIEDEGKSTLNALMRFYPLDLEKQQFLSDGLQYNVISSKKIEFQVSQF